MTKRLFLLTCLFASLIQTATANPSWQEQGDESLWQIFPAYTYCTDNIVVGKRVYALTESNLFAYDTEDLSGVTFD